MARWCLVPEKLLLPLGWLTLPGPNLPTQFLLLPLPSSQHLPCTCPNTFMPEGARAPVATLSRCAIHYTVILLQDRGFFSLLGPPLAAVKGARRR